VKIVFWSPHTGIWEQAFPEALLAKTLRERGHDVLHVGCGRALGLHCVVMSAFRTKPDAPEWKKRVICADCSAKRALLARSQGLRATTMAKWLSAEDHREAERLASVSADALTALVDSGVPVGRAATYDFILEHKKSAFDLSPAEQDLYRIAVRTTTLAARAASRVLDDERPDRVVMYNSLYAAHAACRHAAARRNIPVYTLHAGLGLASRFQRLFAARDDNFHYFRQLLAHWPKWRSAPCSAAAVKEVTSHLHRLLRGDHFLVYSAPPGGGSNVRRRFGIGAHQRILVATLSSYDEKLAAELAGALPPDSYQGLFPSQRDWIAALGSFIEKRPDLFLIVRVHPRELPNKREGVESEHARRLRETLAHLPANVAVNWPDQPIALYDLFSEAAAVLNAWSSAGAEAALFGVPSVTHLRDLLTYPPELGFVAETREEYFAAVERAAVAGFSFDRVRQAYRWHALRFVHSTVDLSDGWRPPAERSDRVTRLMRKAERVALPLLRPVGDVVRARHAPLGIATLARLIEDDRDSVLDLIEPQAASAEAAAREDEAIRAGLRSLRHVLYAGADPTWRPPLRTALETLG